MRINVYTEELLSGNDPGFPAVEIVSAEYVSSRTGKNMTNYGLRIYLKSAPALHYIPGRDDDRSAITFWCGNNRSNIFAFLEMIRHNANEFERVRWRTKMQTVAEATEEAIAHEREDRESTAACGDPQ